jgi:anaerobic selenocysteine-containing dehydrogenase
LAAACSQNSQNDDSISQPLRLARCLDKDDEAAMTQPRKDAAKRLLDTLPRAASELIRQTKGPLTRDLLRTPARFGLGQLPSKLAPDATTRTVCGFCATGCGLEVHLRDNQAVNLSPSSDYPVNLGMACPKGWEALAPLDAPDRATTPLLRGEDGELHEASWDEALQEMTGRLHAIKSEYGGDAMAFLSTGQIPTEEMLALGALARFGIGMHHGDGNTRQCMATAATAYKESFGFDAPPYTYADFEESDVIVLVGSNLCIAHPIMWERICKNQNAPEIVVVDPRKTETAVAATDHYAIRPKSDLLFLYAIANQLISTGHIDTTYVANHTEDFDRFSEFVSEFTPERVSDRVGLPVEDFTRLTQTIASGKRVSFWWTMGVNQGHEAVRTAQAIINLALMTGNMGRPGTGANSITGQCNAMGSRLFSNTTGLFAGRDFTSAADRQDVARILDIDEGSIPRQTGLAYDQIVEGIRAGRIKALWVIATNSAHSWINQEDFRSVVDKLDLFVVQDMYTSTETALLADIVLPAAGWGEKEGTFINSERRIGVIKKVRRAPGQALADFHIFRLVAEYWGCSHLFEHWKTPEDVFDSMKALSAGRPCDITGIEGYGMLDALGGVQWPHPGGSCQPAPERRLFEDGLFHRENQRARFIFAPPTDVPEPASAEHPFILLTGRGASSQWHTQTRTAKSSVLRKLYRNDAWVEIHPDDARSLGIAAESQVRVHSLRGEMTARAVLSATIGPGQLFIPMHYAGTNRLTHPSFDPHSRQPSYKHCAVAIEPIP